MLFDF